MQSEKIIVFFRFASVECCVCNSAVIELAFTPGRTMNKTRLKFSSMIWTITSQPSFYRHNQVFSSDNKNEVESQTGTGG